MKPNDIVILIDASKYFHFHKPLKIYSTRRLDQVVSFLQNIEERVEKEHLFAAGFISYEASPAFDPALKVKPSKDFPLLWFGLYSKPKIFHITENDLKQKRNKPGVSLSFIPEISHEEYYNAFKNIKEYIKKGDCYQVNFSFGLTNLTDLDARDFFWAMQNLQRGNFSSYIRTDSFSICSASPELFFKLDQNKLISKPMKGTSPRGLWYEQDVFYADHLRSSQKERSENVMIVDMIRNDMSKIAQSGSVETVSLFDIERYPTLLQMTSTVECITNQRVSQIFKALFPGASITGAPKIRASEIICGLEKTPRKIYTGAIGFIAPKRQAQFNISIRTLLINERQKTAEYRIGSGIVWDSDPKKEWDECYTKANILNTMTRRFSLLETFLWHPDTHFFLFEEHLKRLKKSAEYFLFSIDLHLIREKMIAYGKSLASRSSSQQVRQNQSNEFNKKSYKIRLLVSHEGRVDIESNVLEENPKRYLVKIAEKPIDHSDVFLYHKTTNRDPYKQALTVPEGYNDLLFWNRRGELTESSIANLVCEINKKLVTPPIECGLLPGVYRNFLLSEKKIKEKKIFVKELKQISHIFLINSVRKMWEIFLDDQQNS